MAQVVARGGAGSPQAVQLTAQQNKSGKADVVAQFDRSLRFITDDGATDWEHRAAELERLRDSLNGYARALHRWLRESAWKQVHRCRR